MRQLKIECQRVEEFEQFVAAEQVLFFYPGRGFRVLSELGFEFFLALQFSQQHRVDLGPILLRNFVDHDRTGDRPYRRLYNPQLCMLDSMAHDPGKLEPSA